MEAGRELDAKGDDLKEALDLLRKYIDLQIVLELKSEQAARLDYYDESIPSIRNEIEETWKAFAERLLSSA